MARICRGVTSRNKRKGEAYMEKEVILISKDKKHAELIGEMSNNLVNSWIFIHENVYEHLLKSVGARISGGDSVNRKKEICIILEATDQCPKTVVFCEKPESYGWGKITTIALANSMYYNCPIDPEKICFIKMQE